MILDNEVIVHLIRSGKGRKTFSKSTNLANYVDADNHVLPNRQRMPLLDALVCVIDTGISLYPDQIHPGEFVGIEVATDVVRDLILSLVRTQPIQADIDDDPDSKGFERQVDKEVKDAHAANKVADSILKKLASTEKLKEKQGEKFDSKKDFSMDDYVKAVATSPSPDFTKLLLSDAGPDRTKWISPSGPLSPLTYPMTPALTAKHAVDIVVRVLYVREKHGVAMVEIASKTNDYSQQMLCHHNAEVELRFDPAQIERDDLVLMQYLKKDIPLRVAAICATHSKVSRKTVLTLNKLLVSRTALNELHVRFRQLDLPLE
jgi:hypothetical protein